MQIKRCLMRYIKFQKIQCETQSRCKRGWDVNQTIEMMDWLSKREVDYIEQPLKEGMNPI